MLYFLKLLNGSLSLMYNHILQKSKKKMVIVYNTKQMVGIVNSQQFSINYRGIGQFGKCGSKPKESTIRHPSR
jgi:hypothetical protein